MPNLKEIDRDDYNPRFSDIGVPNSGITIFKDSKKTFKKDPQSTQNWQDFGDIYRFSFVIKKGMEISRKVSFGTWGDAKWGVMVDSNTLNLDPPANGGIDHIAFYQESAHSWVKFWDKDTLLTENGNHLLVGNLELNTIYDSKFVVTNDFHIEYYLNGEHVATSVNTYENTLLTPMTGIFTAGYEITVDSHVIKAPPGNS